MKMRVSERINEKLGKSERIVIVCNLPHHDSSPDILRLVLPGCYATRGLICQHLDIYELFLNGTFHITN